MDAAYELPLALSNTKIMTVMEMERGMGRTARCGRNAWTGAPDMTRRMRPVQDCLLRD